MFNKSFLSFLVALVCLLPFYGQAQQKSSQTSLRFGKGLRVAAIDSSMYLKSGFRFQSLFNSERALEDDAPWNTNFLVRRARLKFDGWAVTPNLGYKIELALSNKDLASASDFEETGESPKIILDAVLKWKFHQNFTLWAGQTKLPGNRERVVSSQKLQFVDRSLVNSIFNLDREMGVQLHGKFKTGDAVIKPIISWSFGEGRNVTKSNVGGYHYMGRLEFLPTGEFAKKGDYFSVDLAREAKPKVAFGASYSFNDGGSRQKQSGKFLVDTSGNYFEHNLETVIADMIFKYNGFSFHAEFAHKKISENQMLKDGFESREELIDANGRSYYTGRGLNLQAGYLFKNNIEIAGRFTNVVPDVAISFKELNEYTFGVSKYIVGHNLKLQADVSLQDYAASTNKLRYRFQFEFAF